MDLDAFRELLTPAGQGALVAAAALAPTEPAFLACFEKLRKRFPEPVAKAALETVLLRVRARGKFAAADRMYFTREALEQSSGDAVARHRAARLAPFGEVADLCCGIGGDSLAFAVAGLTVHAVELDPLRAAMAKANAAALGLTDRVTVHEADSLTAALPTVRAAFADPNRRSPLRSGAPGTPRDVRRHLDPADYTPPLPAIRGRFAPDFPLGVKIAPGVAWDDVGGLGAEAEFISVGGELKECVLWFGPLRTTARRATVLPAGLSLAADEPPALPPVVSVADYVFDPDPTVVRAGLAGLLATRLGVSPIDWRVMLFTGRELIASPLVTAYSVEYAERFNAGRLRDYLRKWQIGRVTVVKRGSTLDAEGVVKSLKIRGQHHRVLLLTQAQGEQFAVVGGRVESPPGGSHPHGALGLIDDTVR